jgi:hypothetical protein
MITSVAALGQQQSGRSASFPPDKRITAILPMPPGDSTRAYYELLVRQLGVSGAEVLRRGLRALAREEGIEPPTQPGPLETSQEGRMS